MRIRGPSGPLSRLTLSIVLSMTTRRARRIRIANNAMKRSANQAGSSALGNWHTPRYTPKARKMLREASRASFQDFLASIDL